MSIIPQLKCFKKPKNKKEVLKKEKKDKKRKKRKRKKEFVSIWEDL